ncbi:MAG: hypothetical protein GVY36_02115 [Verrucomicrobia bacterium]|jgi:hypothetical protein|nr:hypothetical protein [Verrucomicrobiota bacterium]
MNLLLPLALTPAVAWAAGPSGTPLIHNTESPYAKLRGVPMQDTAFVDGKPKFYDN